MITMLCLPLVLISCDGHAQASTDPTSSHALFHLDKTDLRQQALTLVKDHGVRNNLKVLTIN